jgi:hydrogenase nickel incorporation protein HypA/HybF
MHELSVTQHLLAIVLEHAEKAGARRVVRVNLRIGALAGIVDESVQFYFDFVSRDTPAAGAELSFARVPARFQCRECGAEFEPEERDWLCPGCGATGGRLIAGREMAVESIEVE